MNKIGKSTLCLSIVLLAVAPVFAAENGWQERINLKGDLRLRYEGIDEEFEENRSRIRFRARFGFSAKLGDDVTIVMQLASGGDNPVSTNQALDAGFSSKDISLDLAYVDWKINNKLRLNAGKIKNPQFRAGGTPLIWDSDLNPEGVALRYTDGGFFGTVAGSSVEERDGEADSLLYTLQAGYEWALDDSASLAIGGGYFAYSNTIGNAAFFNGRAKGNTLDAAGNYAFDYRNIELFAELATDPGGYPLTLFAHVVRNDAVDRQDTAYAFGAKIGSTKDVGGMEFSWAFQDIEADAVIGTFNDSDFGGGGTDSKGHLLKGKYAIGRKIFLAGTLILTEVDRFQGTPHDYERIQIDVEFKFD